MPFNGPENVNFRMLVTARFDGQDKPVLLVGTLHGTLEDASVVAVLNPDEDLLPSVSSGYLGGEDAAELVTGRCDAMVALWIEAYGQGSCSVSVSYQNPSPRPPQFVISG